VGIPGENPVTGISALCYNPSMAAFECLPDFFGSVPQLSFPDEMHNGK
jgi:hypothetical protein